MKKILFHLLLPVLLAVPALLNAQIVNTESARMQSDTVGWMGGFGATMNLTQNTRQIFGVDLETHLQYKTSSDRGIWMILGGYSFLRSEDVKLVSSSFFHLRYNKKVTEWLRWEIFGQFQRNLVTQINSRVLFGTGPRFKLVKTKKFRLYVASLAMYEQEKEKTTPAVRHRDVRSSSYLTFTWLPRENMEMISTTYYQPLFSNFKDHRILNNISFKVKASPHFALSVKWNYLFDRFPAGTAPKTTYTYATGIDYDF